MNDVVDDNFIQIIDDVILSEDSDPELVEGLRWIDSQAHKNQMSFYEMAMIVLRKHMAEKKAKDWLNSR